ncbi:MAG: hypothetical protein U5L06_00465 [Rhodovibrio sp.]|nr:hypothetical protein [Rhodovibrio sp.]
MRTRTIGGWTLAGSPRINPSPDAATLPDLSAPELSGRGAAGASDLAPGATAA